MNRRKAKKRVKAKWRLAQWHGNDKPRDIDLLLTMYTDYLKRRIFEEVFPEVMDGSADGGLHTMPKN